MGNEFTKEQIKELALEAGFKLNGSEDLNPYVYDFAEKLLNSRRMVITAGRGDLQIGQGIMGHLPAIFITRLDKPVEIGEELITEMTPVEDFIVCLQFEKLESAKVLINQSLLLLQHQGDEPQQSVVPTEALAKILNVASEAIIADLSDYWTSGKGCSTWADHEVETYDMVAQAIGLSTIRQQVTGDSDD